MIIKFLKDVKNLQELKKAYFTLAKELHPDLNGSIEDMQVLNAEYDYLKTTLNNDTTIKNKAYNETASSMEGFKDIINDLIRFNDLEFEIIGTWLYIKGNTFVIKDYLKDQYHCRFSKTHKCWYWFNGIENSNKTRANKKYYDKNKSMYGVMSVKSEGIGLIG